MGRRANPYPGWWASPDRDSDDEPIDGPCWKDVPCDLPPEYRGSCKYTRQSDNRYEWEKEDYYRDADNGFKSGFWDNFFFGSGSSGHQQSFSQSEPYEDPYNILGMKKSDSNDDLKKGYYKKAKKYHPDRGGKKELFQKLSNAWEQIKFWRGMD